MGKKRGKHAAPDGALRRCPSLPRVPPCAGRARDGPVDPLGMSIKWPRIQKNETW